jgi:hypothetical protein
MNIKAGKEKGMDSLKASRKEYNHAADFFFSPPLGILWIKPEALRSS